MTQNQRRRASGNDDETSDTGGKASWLKRGKDIEKTAENEMEQQERKRESRASGNRFWLPNDNKTDKKTNLPSNEADIVILDDSIEDAVALYEHRIPAADGSFGKGSHNELCTKELEPCPLCEKYGDSSYILFITILDLRPYQKDNGDWVEYSRKLLPIKTRDIPKFKQMEKAAIKKNGTLRGTFITMVRDTKNSQSSSIGEPQIRENGMLFSWYPEKQMVKEFGHDAIKGRDGTQLLKADELLEPLDYDKIFPKPDADDIRRRFHIRAGAGSDSEARNEWAKDDDKPRSRRRGPAADDDDDIPDNNKGKRVKPDDDDDADKPRSRRRGPDDDDDDAKATPKRKVADDDDAPPARSRKVADDDAKPRERSRSRRPADGDEPFGKES